MSMSGAVLVWAGVWSEEDPARGGVLQQVISDLLRCPSSLQRWSARFASMGLSTLHLMTEKLMRLPGSA